jgi:hypothetical protein
MLQKKMFLLIVFLMSLTFSGFNVAQAEEDSDSETVVRLLRIREVLLKSFSSNQIETFSLPASVQAKISGENMVVAVENFKGTLEIEIYGLSGTGSVGEVYSVNGSGVYALDISQLKAGFYLMKLHLGTTTYAGKFSIK